MDDRREVECAAPACPATLAQALDGYRWSRSTVGMSGGTVHRLDGGAGMPGMYLKHGRGTVADDVVDEMARLRWLRRHLPVPEVHQSLTVADQAWLLTAALPGETAYQALTARPDERMAVVDGLAAFLRRLHAIPIDDCPFNSDHRVRLGRARHRIDAGLVEEDEFDAEREGWTAEQVWDGLQQLLPLASDPVVTHGDYSLDNILIADGAPVGCIDVGRAGVADRYQDVAIMWQCLGEFDGALQDRFLAQYGLDAPDRSKLQFHLMLDEMF